MYAPLKNWTFGQMSVKAYCVRVRICKFPCTLTSPCLKACHVSLPHFTGAGHALELEVPDLVGRWWMSSYRLPRRSCDSHLFPAFVGLGNG